VLYDGAINVSTDVVLDGLHAKTLRPIGYFPLILLWNYGSHNNDNRNILYVNGLDYGTTYYWRIEAINDSGSNMSDTSSFTTVSAEEQEVPAVTTGSASSLRYDSAVLNGTVTNYGMPAISQYGFVWNTTGTPTISDNCIELGTRYATGDYTADMTGLQPDTTYYVRALRQRCRYVIRRRDPLFTTSSYPVVTFTVDKGPGTARGFQSIHSTTLTTGSDGNGAYFTSERNKFLHGFRQWLYNKLGQRYAFRFGFRVVSVSLSKTTYSVTISVTDERLRWTVQR
jgi:hypothetical protein